MKTKAGKSNQKLLAQVKALRLNSGSDAAESLCRKLLRKTPNDTEVIFILGTLKLDKGDFDAAEPLLRQVLVLNPQHADAMHNLGTGLNRAGRHVEALELLQQEVQLRPNSGDALNSLGSVLFDLQQMDAAEFAFRRAIELEPQRSMFHRNLAILVQSLDQWKQAEASLLRAVEIDPDDVGTLNQLGVLYIQLGRLRDGAAVFRRALALPPTPESYKLHNNLSLCLSELGQFAEALTHHALLPESYPAYVSLAYTKLAMGQLGEGWAAYKQRNNKSVINDGTKLSRAIPEWQGEDLTGRLLLVTPEQGLGDEILFASCLPDVLARADKIVIICEQRLGALYDRSFPTAEVHAVREPNAPSWTCDFSHCDYQIFIGDLPGLLRARIEDFPNRVGCLLADPVQVAEWRNRLATLSAGPKIGICWRSGLLKGVRHREYTPIQTWEPILTLPGVTFINLQYDDCAEELEKIQEWFGVEVVNFTDLDLRNDQDGVAALISALDVVVSAHTAVGALAGALGLPTLLYGIGWSSLGTDYYPWFPNTRVFPRSDPEAPWDETMAAIAAALREWIAQRETIANAATLPIPLQFAETRHGPMLVAGADAAVRDLLRNDAEAPDAAAFLISLLRSGDWIIEAGAGIGAYTLPLARAVGSEGWIVACESDRDAFRLLCANLALNGINQVHAECVALDATTLLETSEPRTAWVRTRRPSAQSIDNLALPRCDLIRIGTGVDAQAVLNGARATLERCKPFIHLSADATDSPTLDQSGHTIYGWQKVNEIDGRTDWIGYPAGKTSH